MGERNRADPHNAPHLTTFLRWLNGLATSPPQNLFIIAATNVLETCDPAFVSRCQMTIEVKPPTQNLRFQWWQRVGARHLDDSAWEALSAFEATSFRLLNQVGDEVEERVMEMCCSLPEEDWYLPTLEHYRAALVARFTSISSSISSHDREEANNDKAWLTSDNARLHKAISNMRNEKNVLSKQVGKLSEQVNALLVDLFTSRAECAGATSKREDREAEIRQTQLTAETATAALKKLEARCWNFVRFRFARKFSDLTSCIEAGIQRGRSSGSLESEALGTNSHFKFRLGISWHEEGSWSGYPPTIVLQCYTKIKPSSQLVPGTLHSQTMCMLDEKLPSIRIQEQTRTFALRACDPDIWEAPASNCSVRFVGRLYCRDDSIWVDADVGVKGEAASADHADSVITLK